MRELKNTELISDFDYFMDKLSIPKRDDKLLLVKLK